MKDMLKNLPKNSQKAIEDGVYEINYKNQKSEKNLVEQIRNNKHASLITEIKFSSPSLGNIRQISDPVADCKTNGRWRCSGLSVLTQPYLFNGSPEYFKKFENRSMFHC